MQETAHRAATDGLALYASAWCFACRRVINAIDELGLDLEVCDVNGDPGHRQVMRRATGRGTVPVLRIRHPDGREEWMFESRDIVRYLQARFGPPR